MKTILQKTPTTLFKHLILSALFLVASLPLWAQRDTCRVPMVPPGFSVTERHWDVPQSFWQNGGHIPENTVDEDTTNYARAHIKATGSATLRVSALDTVMTAGSFAGFYVKSRAFRDGDFSGVTINTYLNGVLQESFTGDELWVEYIPTYVNDPIMIGFFTTTSWNEVEIIFSADGPRVHYDVFYAVTMGSCENNNEELPPGLPLTWLSFEVQKKGEASDLKWTTAQEFNNAGFHVERSADGRYFEPIASINPVGDSREVNVYHYTDMKPYSGLNYYRIRQTDRDGKFSFSTIRSVSFTTTDAAEIKMWPNPASASLHVELPAINATGEIRLVNSVGVVVMSQRYETTDRESTLNLNGIDSGVYSLIIETPLNRLVKNVVVLK